MTQNCLHSFDPPANRAVAGATVDLTVKEIDGTGIHEVLRTPGAACGAWSILNESPAPTGAEMPYFFKEQLGKARSESRAFRFVRAHAAAPDRSRNLRQAAAAQTIRDRIATKRSTEAKGRQRPNLSYRVKCRSHLHGLASRRTLSRMRRTASRSIGRRGFEIDIGPIVNLVCLQRLKRLANACFQRTARSGKS